MKKALLCALAAALLLSLTACGTAAVHLQSTQGTVTVSDSGGRELETTGNPVLPGGSRVETHSQSFAWLDLDGAGLVKLDQDSAVELAGEGGTLELQAGPGRLFFRLPASPDGEVVTVRTGAAAAELQGTGWVTVSGGGALQVFLLEGAARCETGEAAQTIQTGETAFLPGDGQLIAGTFAKGDVPAFVCEELEEDDPLLETLPEGGGPGWARAA